MGNFSFADFLKIHKCLFFSDMDCFANLPLKVLNIGNSIFIFLTILCKCFKSVFEGLFSENKRKQNEKSVAYCLEIYVRLKALQIFFPFVLFLHDLCLSLSACRTCVSNSQKIIPTLMFPLVLISFLLSVMDFHIIYGKSQIK